MPVKAPVCLVPPVQVAVQERRYQRQGILPAMFGRTPQEITSSRGIRRAGVPAVLG
ncbi:MULTISPECIES: hypothetical protein [unclassified Corynebacterium]|uniref:hypothetical protein n=1 Tax=unclassified Corynebacterium TaxID=2624378 RepID=UPI00143A3BA1|nr:MULTISPECIES: hypothetical protein [unclassified Corynebacterium]